MTPLRKKEFLMTLFPHAENAIGTQHSWLIRWALAKAAVECNWNLENVLIVKASNCLGIKAGFQDIAGQWHVFPGVAAYIHQANTGPEAGDNIPWRVFVGLEACFREFVRMLNDRTPYETSRMVFMHSFESAYTGNLSGHAASVMGASHDVRDYLQELGVTDEKGRIRQHVV